MLNVRNTSQWAAAVDAHIVPGDTAALDYTFFLHPGAIGHWLELAFPLFSALLHSPHPSFKRTPDRLMVLYQKRGRGLTLHPAVPSVLRTKQRSHDGSTEQHSNDRLTEQRQS